MAPVVKVNEMSLGLTPDLTPRKAGDYVTRRVKAPADEARQDWTGRALRFER
jgi:hypothetical protein